MQVNDEALKSYLSTTVTSRLLFRTFLGICLAGCINATAMSQRRGVEPPTAGPRRGAPLLEREERPTSETAARKLASDKIKVAPNNGALVMWLASGAKVSLTPIPVTKSGKRQDYNLGQNDNKLTLRSLIPSKYKLEVSHSDYQPYVKEIDVGRGEIVSLLVDQVSRYGSIIVGGAPPGSKLLLDGRELAAADYKSDEQGRLVIRKVPVGKRILKVSHQGFDDWVGNVEVKPGEPTPETAILKPATITLSVKTRVGAQVYLDDVSRGEVPRNGLIVIADLPPGDHRLSVRSDGYEQFDKGLTLSLNNRAVTVEVELIPIAESSEAALDDGNPRLNWTPDPSGWGFEKKGIVIRGSSLLLFKSANEKRQFNHYRDFTLHLGLSFENGKGAAWIVRAKDFKNYYLFELTTSKGAGGRKMFNVYVCRDGNLEFVKGTNVVDDIDNPKAFIRIVLEARGNRFIHNIEVSTDTRPQLRPLGDFTDEKNTFAIGGIGFQGFKGVETVIHQLHVIPAKTK